MFVLNRHCPSFSDDASGLTQQLSADNFAHMGRGQIPLFVGLDNKASLQYPVPGSVLMLSASKVAGLVYADAFSMTIPYISNLNTAIPFVTSSPMVLTVNMSSLYIPHTYAPTSSPTVAPTSSPTMAGKC